MDHRLKGLPNPTIPGLIQALAAENTPKGQVYPGGSLEALAKCHDSLGEAVIPLFVVLDMKHLYGQRIWDLYKFCKEDIKRFIYHVGVELPDQETGNWIVPRDPIFLPRNPAYLTKEFAAARRFGQPGFFWALENPPADGNYEFPILEV